MASVKDKILEKLDHLPEPKLREVLTFVEFLTWRMGDQDEPLLSITGILSGKPISAKEIEQELYGDTKEEA
jgi:hypothetical protein